MRTKNGKAYSIWLLVVFLAIILISDGSEAATGKWRKDKTGYWYSYPDGSYARNEWIKDKNRWYYLNEKGYVQTGWKKLSGKWYYFAGSGAMQTGWKKLTGKWYYFAGSGVMQTGWKKLSGKWYYFTESGEMVTGWIEIGNIPYFFQFEDGTLKTGIIERWPYTYELDENGKFLKMTYYGMDVCVNHTPVIDEAIEATCEYVGWTEGSHCAVCHTTIIEQKAIPKKNHTIVIDEAVEAICGHSGWTEGSHCEVCGTTLIEQEEIPAPAEEHSFVHRENEYGSEDYVCEICGYVAFSWYGCGCGCMGTEHTRVKTVNGIEFCLADWEEEYVLDDSYEIKRMFNITHGEYEDVKCYNTSAHAHIGTTYRGVINPDDLTYRIDYPTSFFDYQGSDYDQMMEHMFLGDEICPIARMEAGWDGRWLRFWVYSDYGVGSFRLHVYYQGEEVASTLIKINTPDPELLEQLEFVRTLEQGAGWTDEMTNREKLNLLEQYIEKHLKYSECSCKIGARYMMLAARYDLGIYGCYYKFSDYPEYNNVEWYNCAVPDGHTYIMIPLEDGVYERYDVQGYLE